RREAGNRRRGGRGDGGGRGGAVGKVGGDREARAAGERRGIRVTGEHVDGAAVGDGGVHRTVAGVEECAVEAGRDAKGPERRGRVSVPGAAAAVAAQLEAGQGARAAPGLEAQAERAVQRAVGAVRRRVRTDLVPELAQERQAERRRRRGHGGTALLDRDLAVRVRDRHVTRTHRGGRADRDGDVQLRRRRDRRGGHRDVRAEGGGRARLEVRSGHRDGERRARRAGARGHARDRRHRRQGDGRGRRGAVGEVGGDREARAAGERRRIRGTGGTV